MGLFAVDPSLALWVEHGTPRAGVPACAAFLTDGRLDDVLLFSLTEYGTPGTLLLTGTTSLAITGDRICHIHDTCTY